MDEDCSL